MCYCCGLLGHQDRECPLLKTGCFAADFQFGAWLRSMASRGGRKKDAGIPHSMARDVDDEHVLSVFEEPEESQHIGRPAKELPMVDGIGNPAHPVATPGSITAVVARENLLSAVTQEDSNVRKDIAVPDSVLAFDSKSKLIIQDLDKAKISPDKVIKDNSIEEPGDNYEDIEMESCSDVNTENTEQRKSSLRSWKRVLRNKGISNSKVSVNPTFLLTPLQTAF